MALIAVVAMLLFGPDRLPSLAKQAAEFVGAARRMLDQTKEQVGREIGHDLSEYRVVDLDPRSVVRRAMQDNETTEP